MDKRNSNAVKKALIINLFVVFPSQQIGLMLNFFCSGPKVVIKLGLKPLLLYHASSSAYKKQATKHLYKRSIFRVFKLLN